MFDLSWVELFFVATLALVVVGPKDMPKLFQIIGKFFRKVRRLYGEFLGGVHQLEKEIDIASSDTNGSESWKDLMPEHIRNLPDDFIPGSMTAAQHQKRHKALNDAVQENSENTTNTQNSRES